VTDEQGQQEEAVVEEEAQETTEPQEGEMEDGADEFAALEEALEQAKAKEAEYLDGWQRARAELANARKRFQREQAEAYANAKSDLLLRLLPVVDDFERAFETLPEAADADWTQGISLILQKLQGLLGQEQVTPIESEGQEFDPFQHQAVTHEPSEDVPCGYVIAELQRGYTVRDRVLRPAMVRVSAGPPPEPEPEADVATEPKEDEAEQDEA
jgi:molecular chaperone GrpE